MQCPHWGSIAIGFERTLRSKHEKKLLCHLASSGYSHRVMPGRGQWPPAELWHIGNRGTSEGNR
jgi:hypothetical protein